MKGNARSEKSTYLCQQCGYRSSKWMGFCPQCRSPEALAQTTTVSHTASIDDISVVPATARHTTVRDRNPTGLVEIDRVLGGGIVPGAAILVGGEPGIGKSTLLLQVADRIASTVGPVLVATAEESAHQVQMRARRIGITSDEVLIAPVHDVDAIVSLAEQRQPAAVVVDSIQTVSTVEASGSAGGVAQVRDSAARLISFAKTSGTPVILVGHVTKDGSIAGPRTLEHMVDVVLYLEGESDVGLRFLRSIKNRYGSANEVGVFEMTAEGLAEVSDPSGLLVAQRVETSPGSALFPAIEGKRPMVVEIQALVVDTGASVPRRSVNGLPPARVHQVLGVLSRHAGLPLATKEVYVSVMGGIKITEPAVDLPVALAVASAVNGVPLRRIAAWGELGLTGDIRPVSRPAVRKREIERISAGPIISPEAGHRDLAKAIAEAGLTRR
ncbi:MAG: DNA repair protein RadA [Armatimonadetes bacterium]|nr:MAG: DNA repair protein RadA [Armatimonadota bacterium]